MSYIQRGHAVPNAHNIYRIPRRAALFPIDMLVGLALCTTRLHYDDFGINCMPVVPKEVNDYLYQGSSPCNLTVAFMYKPVRVYLTNRFECIIKFCSWIHHGLEVFFSSDYL